MNKSTFQFKSMLLVSAMLLVVLAFGIGGCKKSSDDAADVPLMKNAPPPPPIPPNVQRLSPSGPGVGGGGATAAKSPV